jgi:hypothetical protein
VLTRTVTKQKETLPAGGGEVDALVWSLPGSGKGGQAGAIFLSTKVDLSFSAAEFPEIHCDWRISRNSDVTRTFILRVASTPNAVDYHASELNLAPTLVSATVETQADDSLGRMQLTDWFSYDVQINRTMLLAGAEGVLLVRDVVDVGPTAAQGVQAGPIWHFGPVATPVLGGDKTLSGHQWVLSQNASVNLCVAFSLHSLQEPSAVLTVGAQRVDVWSKPGQQSAFGNTTLTAGRHSFASLLVPVRSSDLPPAVLRSFATTLAQTADGVTATVSWERAKCSASDFCGTALDITLTDSNWSVHRRPLL